MRGEGLPICKPKKVTLLLATARDGHRSEAVLTRVSATTWHVLWRTETAAGKRGLRMVTRGQVIETGASRPSLEGISRPTMVRTR